MLAELTWSVYRLKHLPGILKSQRRSWGMHWRLRAITIPMPDAICTNAIAAAPQKKGFLFFEVGTKSRTHSVKMATLSSGSTIE